jgi:hypothetical protein
VTEFITPLIRVCRFVAVERAPVRRAGLHGLWSAIVGHRDIRAPRSCSGFGGARDHVARGLTIPGKHVDVQLPLGETVPVTLKLDRAETIELQCANDDARASIVVAPR